jgi:hypothetical protein
MEIKTATDWAWLEGAITHGLPDYIRGRRDVRRLINNIYVEVKVLSNLEMELRIAQGSMQRSAPYRTRQVAEQCVKINEMIHNAQKLFTFGMLVLGK